MALALRREPSTTGGSIRARAPRHQTVVKPTLAVVPKRRRWPAVVGALAWTALFGGPGYLLLAVLLGWVVPSWAAFCAVAAFVGGFATLVVRMGDRPPGDSGPDDGAVV